MRVTFTEDGFTLKVAFTGDGFKLRVAFTVYGFTLRVHWWLKLLSSIACVLSHLQ